MINPNFMCQELLFNAEKYSMVWIYHILFNHSLIEGNLGCFQCGDITKKAVINIGVQIFVQICFHLSAINVQE